MGFSENLKAVRKANKMTQQQLADELGLGRPAIAKYETSDTLPKPRNIMKICEIFNLTFDELFSDENILEHLAARSEETAPTDCAEAGGDFFPPVRGCKKSAEIPRCDVGIAPYDQA